MTHTKEKELKSLEVTLLKSLELVQVEIDHALTYGEVLGDLVCKKVKIKRQLRIVQAVLNGKLNKNNLLDRETREYVEWLQG